MFFLLCFLGVNKFIRLIEYRVSGRGFLTTKRNIEFIEIILINKINKYIKEGMFIIFYFFIITNICSYAMASELHFVVNGKSIHGNERVEKSYNESNTGAGLQYDFDETDKRIIPFINMGGFSDSNNNPSYYLGGGLMHRTKIRKKWLNFYIDAGITAFVMSRKNVSDTLDGDGGTGVTPGLLPVLSIGTDVAAVNLTYIPDSQITGSSVWFFQLKIKLDSF